MIEHRLQALNGFGHTNLGNDPSMVVAADLIQRGRTLIILVRTGRLDDLPAPFFAVTVATVRRSKN